MSIETINLTPALYDYLLDTSVRESAEAKALRLATAAHPRGVMQTSADEANFLRFFLQTMQAKRVIEVGVFTGYGTLHMAQALPEDGQLIACELEDEYPNIGKPFWAQAGVADKIDLRIAPAEATLQQLLDEDQQNQFDFIFIDANKGAYASYYEFALKLLRPGGVVGLDNVLWKGKVADSNSDDKITKTMQTINANLKTDPRVDITLLTIGDGLFLARKK